METQKSNDQDLLAKEEEEPVWIFRSEITPGSFFRQWMKEFKENLSAWQKKYPTFMLLVYSTMILGFLIAVAGAAAGSAFDTLTGACANYIGFLTYAQMGNTKP